MRHTIAIVSLVAVFLAFGPTPSPAQTSTFDLPSQPLAESLKAVGAKANLNVMVSPSVVDGRQAPALKASLTAKDALSQLLKGTGLDYHFINDQTVVIREKGAPASKDPPSERISSIDSQSSTKEGGKNSSQDFRVAQVDQGNSGPQVATDQTTKKEESLTEIVVTGTLIHNVAPITPVTTITQSNLIEQGYTQLADAIFDLPQNFQGAGTSPSSNPASGFGGVAATYNSNYASGINLRGLGGSATLVMLNGRRLAPTAYGGTVDISQIPVGIIDRVEILSDGASALYGSDAVAGVVNIITKHDFSGFEVGGRTTGISEGKTPNYGADLVGGYSWDSGGLVASADYQKDNPLWSRNRTFSDALPNPWALSPQDQSEHIYLSVNQEFTDKLKVSVDSLVSHRDYEAQDNLRGVGPYVANGSVTQYNVSPQLDYSISSDWTATLMGQWSKEQDLSSTTYPDAGDRSTGSTPINYGVISFEPRIDGKLFSLPGGPVRAALGGQWRQETFDYSAIYPFRSAPFVAYDASRHVSSAYGELMVPIVGRDNALPFVRELRVDVSGRYDRYSDFGGTTNPKVGVSWAPVNDLKIHGSYSRSFQAPALFQRTPGPSTLFAAVAPSADPNSPTGSSLGIQDISVANANLQPETAKSFNVGFTYEPNTIPGLKIDASYFSIDFKNEIGYIGGEFCTANNYCSLQDQALLGSLYQKNPSLAQVNGILNNPAYDVFNWAAGNYAPGPYTPSDIKYIANIGLENAASTRIRGVDFAPRYVGPDTAYGRFRADLDASYYTEYKQLITSGAPSLDLDNTTYNPLKFRAKANVGWEERGWSTNLRVNFANAYTNTNIANCPSGGCTSPIGSWTTFDLGLSYAAPNGAGGSWLNGARFAIVVTNIFDRPPPFFKTGYPIDFGYDPVNANALLRSISLTFSKRWGGEGSR